MVGYKARGGSGEAKFMPGKHFVKNALKANESQIKAELLAEIYHGIDIVAAKG